MAIMESMPETAEEALRRWDAGQNLWSIEMGGLGPGYEQAIHIAAFELLRMALPLPRPSDPSDADGWRALGKHIDEMPQPALKGMGLSGAQYGAALNIVMVTLRFGWRAGIEKAPEDRRIQVDKRWPQAPELPAVNA